MHFSQYLYSATSESSEKTLRWYIKSLGEKRPMFDYSLAGLITVVAGIAVIFIATAISSRGRESRTEVKAGGVVMIGPIPIIFGNDTKWVIVAIVLAVVLLALGLLTSLR
jgi:uncharacterized protein (TIGR00304 family)